MKEINYWIKDNKDAVRSLKFLRDSGYTLSAGAKNSIKDAGDITRLIYGGGSLYWDIGVSNVEYQKDNGVDHFDEFLEGLEFKIGDIVIPKKSFEGEHENLGWADAMNETVGLEGTIVSDYKGFAVLVKFEGLSEYYFPRSPKYLKFK